MPGQTTVSPSWLNYIHVNGKFSSVVPNRNQELAVTLPDDGEPIPDIVVVRPQQYRDRHLYPEDVYLIIEIANSRPGRDLGSKRQHGGDWSEYFASARL